jgi:methyl-accepting chemotaxis protein
MLLNYAARDALTGNLSVRTDVTKYPGDFGRILDGNNKTNDSICTLIRGIRDSAVSMAEEAQQLSAGAQSVAQGSTEQAAAIQEISATVGEVLERTKNNSENAAKRGYVRKGQQGSRKRQREDEAADGDAGCDR